MCSDPITQDGNIFACRSCDECVATRRHGWVSRAMAEKAVHPFSACVTLTYSDETQQGRDGAAMFAYADIRLFMARLRDAARYEAKIGKWNIKPYVRFLCAGEQGDRNGRCHWHLILYTNFDLSRLGKFRLSGKLVSHRRDMLTVGKRKRRLNWSLWPAGYMTLQEPDQAGMAYVLSYCLKDQFTVDKSKGSMREARAENFATGLFRMSKRPAIGEEWLYRKLETLLEKASVLPTVQLKIPDMSGYWHPTGSFMEKLLWGLVALNKRILWSTGANAPQWASLLSSCADNETYLKVLNGSLKEQDEESFELEYSKRQRFLADEKRRAKTRVQCGADVACDECLHHVPREALGGFGLERYENDEGWWQYRSTTGLPSIHERRKRDGSGPNPLCRKVGSAEIRDAFPRSCAD